MVDGVAFPRFFRDTSIREVKDYTGRHPGLGRGVLYETRSRVVSVFLYHFNIKGITGDTKSPVLRRHFQRAIGDVVQVSGRENVELQGTYVGRTRSDRLKFLCVSFRIRRGGRHHSHLCLAGFRGRFVKIRITGRKPVGADMRAYIEQFGRLNGT